METRRVSEGAQQADSKPRRRLEETPKMGGVAQLMVLEM